MHKRIKFLLIILVYRLGLCDFEVFLANDMKLLLTPFGIYLIPMRLMLNFYAICCFFIVKFCYTWTAYLHYLLVGLSLILSICMQICTIPLDTAKVRLQLQKKAVAGDGLPLPKYKGLLGTVGTIAKEEGMSALWKGIVPGLHRQCLYGGLRIGLYEPVCLLFVFWLISSFCCFALMFFESFDFCRCT